MKLKEKENIYNWACNASPKEESCFSIINKCSESYYEKREDEHYIKEFSYQTLPELQRELEEIWENDENMNDVMRYVLVAAMRNKPSMELRETKKEVIGDNSQIKPYIYNF